MLNVLLLTPRPQFLVTAIIAAGDTYKVSTAPPYDWPEGADFVVSFGYRHIITEPWLSEYEGRMINIHQSMLPWNRGADPNFWSWYDDTPKGVSIHQIDHGLDTGDVLLQAEIAQWKDAETLRSSYDVLNHCARALFATEWQRLRRGDLASIDPIAPGSYHKTADKEAIMHKLPLGWDTPVRDVEALGRQSRAH